MGIEQIVPEPAHDVLKISEALPAIQAMLALEAYRARHPEENVDSAHPDANPREVRGMAMLEWVGDGGPESLSARFRDYATAHPEVEVDIPEDLPGLLRTIEGNTIH